MIFGPELSLEPQLVRHGIVVVVVVVVVVVRGVVVFVTAVGVVVFVTAGGRVVVVWFAVVVVLRLAACEVRSFVFDSASGESSSVMTATFELFSPPSLVVPPLFELPDPEFVPCAL